MIADMFHKVSFVEKWGRGIGLILSHEPDTRFKEVGRLFITVFRRKYKESEKGIEKGVEKGVEISEKQRIILNLIKEMPNISKERLKIKGGLTKKSVEYNIEKLKQKGLLKRVGPAKGGYWEVVSS